MNNPPFELGSEPDDYEKAQKANIAIALTMVFRNWDIAIENVEMSLVDMRAIDISDHAHTVEVFRATFDVQKEHFLRFSRRLLNHKNIVFTKPNHFSVELFVKTSLMALEGLTEARGYSFVLSLDPNLAIVQHLFPPVGSELADIQHNNNPDIPLYVLSIYDKSVRSLAQVPKLFTENIDYFFKPFLKSLARLHGHGITHGDMILRNVGYRERVDGTVVFGFFDYTSVLSTSVLSTGELDDLPRVISNPNLLINYSSEASDLIYEALVFNKKPSYEPFHLKATDDQFTIALNILKILILRDWEELINNSAELAKLLERAKVSNIQLAHANILNAIEGYFFALSSYHSGLADPRLLLAIQTVLNNRFTKAIIKRQGSL